MDKLQRVWVSEHPKFGISSDGVSFVKTPESYLEKWHNDGWKEQEYYLITKEQLVEALRTADNLRNAGNAQASLVKKILLGLGVE